MNDDYVELFNSDALPVSLGGIALTDDPVGRPDRYIIPPLSFISGQRILGLLSDRNVTQGADHLPFRLAADHGHLALHDRDHTIIDQVIYSWQSIDFSQGRFPDGDAHVSFQAIPTPAASNRVKQQQRETGDRAGMMCGDTIHPERNLRPIGTAPPLTIRIGPCGDGVLAAEDGDLPATIQTPFEIGVMTYYFRRSSRWRMSRIRVRFSS